MPLEQALEARDATLLDVLLRAHADPNQRNPAGIAPLHTAIESRWFEGLAVLAKNQADFSMPDADGITPLERVFADGDRPMLEFLLENKAKPGSGGWSPWLSRAFERNDTGLARLLLSHGATPALRHQNGHLLLEIAASHGLGDWVKLLLC
jgi:ankyrin repeat protein